MYSQVENAIAHILNCGYSDVSMLNNIGYNLDDIVDKLKETNELSLENIFKYAFSVGIKDLSAVIEESRDSIIEELENIIPLLSNEDEEGVDDEDDVFIAFILSKQIEYKVDAERDLRIIKTLSPKNDIALYFNFLDTRMTFVNTDHADVYKRYFSSEIAQFEENTGLVLYGY